MAKIMAKGRRKKVEEFGGCKRGRVGGREIVSEVTMVGALSLLCMLPQAAMQFRGRGCFLQKKYIRRVGPSAT
jgi:hypothetical protein